MMVAARGQAHNKSDGAEPTYKHSHFTHNDESDDDGDTDSLIKPSQSVHRQLSNAAAHIPLTIPTSSTSINQIMKLAVLIALASGAQAFAPTTTSSNSALRMSEVPAEEVAEVAAPTVAPINGWVPDAAQPCYGLPGAISPLGFFDPLGFSNGELGTVKRLREAEIMHGRVSMAATLGYLIGESTPTITYGMDVHHTIANNQLTEVPGTVLFPFFLAINIAEAWRASAGWVEPGLGSLFELREKYYPGDIGFDPFGLKPRT